MGCATVAFWPEPPPPRQLAEAELRAIGTAEQRANQIFQEIWSDFGNGGSPEVAADRIEREVLPIWRRGQARIESAQQSSLAPYIPPRLAEFFKQREIAWTAMTATLRDHDPVDALRCRQAWHSANELAEKIRVSRGR